MKTIQNKIVDYLKHHKKSFTLKEIIHGISEEASDVIREIRKIPRDKIKLISISDSSSMKYKAGRNA